MSSWWRIPYADGGEATVYEHMKAALNFSAEYVGQTGICEAARVLTGMTALEPSVAVTFNGFIPTLLGSGKNS